MLVMVVLAHPYDKSFNAAIYNSVIESLIECGHTVASHDLYRENFNPTYPPGELRTGTSADPQVLGYQEELRSACGIVFVHPNWWGQPPAILTGWIDRVMLENVAYAFGDGGAGGLPQGLLAGKKGLVFNTSNTEPDREEHFFGDPLDRIWKKCIFEFSGITDYNRKTYCIIADSTEEERRDWLRDARTITKQCFPIN